MREKGSREENVSGNRMIICRDTPAFKEKSRQRFLFVIKDVSYFMYIRFNRLSGKYYGTFCTYLCSYLGCLPEIELDLF